MQLNQRKQENDQLKTHLAQFGQLVNQHQQLQTQYNVLLSHSIKDKKQREIEKQKLKQMEKELAKEKQKHKEKEKEKEKERGNKNERKENKIIESKQGHNDKNNDKNKDIQTSKLEIEQTYSVLNEKYRTLNSENIRIIKDNSMLKQLTVQQKTTMEQMTKQYNAQLQTMKQQVKPTNIYN